VNPLVLSVDTTAECGSVALLHGECLLEEVALRAPAGFSRILFGELSSLLARHAIQPADIDCFACASGPGSFTGVRVGMACVKGLAEALSRPAVAVSNLQALAAHGNGAVRAAVIDARRGEVYGGVYDACGAEILPEVVMPLAAWLERVPPEAELVATDWTPFAKALEDTRFAGARLVTAPIAQAAAIARIAAQRWCKGEASDPAALDANYVRRSDAELFWKE
jgi:tRNA threonylcarbamoyladenosine biosynthesis protein TsaB